jgi:hypothetical protein
MRRAGRRRECAPAGRRRWSPAPSARARRRPRPRADADLVEALSDESCSVFIYPASLGDTVAGFQQVIAHELFHCFQAFNFDVRGSYLAYPASAWWVEGSATYFSNVAYPAVNLEWEHTGEFDSRSRTVALTQMSYEATFFFQHLGNTIGNKAIIGLLDTLPVGGDEASHQAALRPPQNGHALPGLRAALSRRRDPGHERRAHPLRARYVRHDGLRPFRHLRLEDSALHHLPSHCGLRPGAHLDAGGRPEG